MASQHGDRAMDIFISIFEFVSEGKIAIPHNLSAHHHHHHQRWLLCVRGRHAGTSLCTHLFMLLMDCCSSQSPNTPQANREGATRWRSTAPFCSRAAVLPYWWDVTKCGCTTVRSTSTSVWWWWWSPYGSTAGCTWCCCILSEYYIIRSKFLHVAIFSSSVRGIIIGSRFFILHHHHKSSFQYCGCCALLL